MIKRETIERIKSSANLVEIIGETVALRRQGSNYSGLCPFHSEKSPSFFVRDSGESFHCFGCGESGNVFSYLMKIRGLSFVEAVEELSSRLGIEIEYDRGPSRSVRRDSSEDLFRVNEIAQSYFMESLSKSSQVVREYLSLRKMTHEALTHFAVGFAPEGWQGLYNYLQKKGVSSESMTRAGLVLKGGRNGFYDRFRGRVIFPIFVDLKRIVGFGGRMIPSLFADDKQNSQPKYLNSPETEIYKKSKTLFGLPQASHSIRESGELFLVEGYMDVIGLWQVGVKNVVATCGTAVTAEHIKRIANLTNRLIVLFDGDSAGRQAASKIFPITKNSGLDVFVKFLGEQDDPDSLAIKCGSSAGKILGEIENRPVFEVFLDSEIERYGGIEAMGAAIKGKLAAEIAEHLKSIQNSIEQASLVEKASQKLRISPDLMNELMYSVAPQNLLIDRTSEPVEHLLNVVTELPRVDQELLRCVMTIHALVVEALSDPAICNGVHAETLNFLMEFSETISDPERSQLEKKERIRQVLSARGESWLSFWRESYEIYQDQRVDMKRNFLECRANYKKGELYQQLTSIEGDISSSSDPDIKANLAVEKIKIERLLRKLCNNRSSELA